MKPVKWRPQAQRDADDAALWFAQQDGLALGERFISQVAATLEHLSRYPGTGSTRHDGIVPGLPVPLRFFPISKFERYLVYYLELPTHVEVIRIWSASRGLEALMENDECDPESTR